METKPFTGHTGTILPELMTASGNMVDLLIPDPEAFVLEDIAWALAHEGRWGNQCRPFYSVAQHSIRVADCLNSCAAAGLMHDAHEFLLRDIGTPFKLLFSGYELCAGRMQDAINKRFGISLTDDDRIAIAEVDRAETRNEAIQLMPESWVRENISKHRISDREGLRPMAPDAAYRCFLERANRYGVK